MIASAQMLRSQRRFFLRSLFGADKKDHESKSKSQTKFGAVRAQNVKPISKPNPKKIDEFWAVRSDAMLPSARMQQMVNEGRLRPDPAQLRVAQVLDRLAKRAMKSAEGDQNSRGGGVYIYGSPGTGKTLVMDVLYECGIVTRQRRVHFHEFLVQMHQRIAALNKLRRDPSLRDGVHDEWLQDILDSFDLDSDEFDVIKALAFAVSREAQLLCFDEFQLTDIGDVVLLTRLLEETWKLGVTVCATSNRHPDELYQNGIQRQEILVPFLRRFLHAQMDIVDLDSDRDYRLLHDDVVDDGAHTVADSTDGDVGVQEEIQHTKGGHLPPVTRDLSDFEHMWQHSILHLEQETTLDLEVGFGRTMRVDRCAHRAACFDFNALMDQPLSAVDYQAVMRQFDTVLLANVPKLTLARRDVLRRFITFVDEAYQHSCRLLLHVPTRIDRVADIFADRQSDSVVDEVFAWQRTASRLSEMGSIEWQEARALDRERHAHLINLARRVYHEADSDHDGKASPSEAAAAVQHVRQTMGDIDANKAENDVHLRKALQAQTVDEFVACVARVRLRPTLLDKSGKTKETEATRCAVQATPAPL
ncbi:MAG: hypothetical protein MHM6MM_001989 [Cercozoa sp. M6MM]